MLILRNLYIMYPLNDSVCNLLETPFNRWKDEDKKDLLNFERPTGSLTICAKKEIKKRSKSFNIKFKRVWFTNFTWLCSSQVLQKLFCWPCLLFSIKNSVWNKEGFVDLVNITRSLHKHADSAEHIKCQLKLKTIEKIGILLQMPFKRMLDCLECNSMKTFV